MSYTMSYNTKREFMFNTFCVISYDFFLNHAFEFPSNLRTKTNEYCNFYNFDRKSKEFNQ